MRRTAAAGVLLAGVMALVVARPATVRAETSPAPVLVVVPDGDAVRDGANAGFSVSAQAGGGVWQTAVVENRSPDLTLRVQLRGVDSDGSPGDAAIWISPTEDRVTIEPRSSRTVRFTVAPPRSVDPGARELALEAVAVEATGPGNAPATLPDPAPHATVPVHVDVLVGAPAHDAAPRSGSESTGRSGDDAVSPTSPSGEGVHDDTTTFTLVLATLLVLTLAAGAQTLFRNHRAARNPSRRPAPAGPAAAGRSERAPTSPGAETPQAPPAPPRPESRMLAWQRRAAERRLALRRERERQRSEARRDAAEMWARAARTARERSEREAVLRAKVRAELTAEGVELSTQLAEVRRAEEELRLAERYRAEATRRADVERLAQERAKEAARRLGTRHAAVRAAADVVRAAETRRRKEADLTRRAVLALRADVARQLATRPAEPALPAAAPVEPLPFEDRVPERFVKATPPPPKPRPRRTVDLTGTRSDEQVPAASSEPETAGSRRTARSTARRRKALAMGVGKTDVTALDVAALNERLSARTGAPRR